MQLILKRLATEIKQDKLDQRSFDKFRMEHVVDADLYNAILPRRTRDDLYKFIGRQGAMTTDNEGLAENTAQLTEPSDCLLSSHLNDTHHNAQIQIKANDIPTILDKFGESVKVLSLDCFDTLLWRKTATPRDVFAVLADNPMARRLGVAPHQRVSAADRAYRAKPLENGSGEIDLGDIYRLFTSLSGEERELLAEAEIRTEMDVCFAFSPYVELIRLARTRGIKVIIVSDTYLREDELRRLLARHLPADVMQAISKIYCSVDYETSKSHALFQIVTKECGVPASQLLHIGDNVVADVQAPRKLGVRALHFLPFDHEVADLLRLQHAASSLIVLDQAVPEAVILPCYSPFRPVFAVANLQPYAPETMIGYMSFGPVLYAYARFLMDEVEALQQQGRRVKIFFLLRDAYLLSAACEAYARKPVGKLVRIRKFLAIAASFKTRADVDYYIGGIDPEDVDDFYATAKQLLLPPEVTEMLIRIAHQSADPRTAFHQVLRDDDVLELIFKNSLALRVRLMRYMSKEMEIEEGDTIVLADIAYYGTTQEYLIRTFKEEFKVDILGRYLVASDEPYRPANGKALISAPHWDYDLFEQCCILKEGMVVDYDLNGDPVLDEIRLSEGQYKKVVKVQDECLRFINDARSFFAEAGVTHEYSILQRAAHAALFRHAYIPIEAELEFFKGFQNDKFMGPDGTKSLYHLDSAWKNVRCLPSPYRLGAYETRSLGLDFVLSRLVKRRFQLDLKPEDMNVRFSPLKVSIGSIHESKGFLLRASHLYDGYFSIVLPYASGTSIKLFLGEHYEWLQLEILELLNNATGVFKNFSNSLDLEQINREGYVYRCLSKASVATIPAVDLQQFKLPHYYHVIFRPLVSRVTDPPGIPGASQ
ncbi:hypothetical protein NKH24_34785 [Mesorhizobium sp. M1300]|uniref:HAD family hydrolase n=1 Tax=Mesorhizobium sp. M1300 TaxID=2957077 RepID=UPI00333DFE4E